MKRNHGFWDRLAEGVDLPGEAMPRQPILEIVGDRRVLIENHMGVTEYTLEKIRIRMNYGEVCICGSGLQLARMSRDQLVISGRIYSASLCRRGE